MSLKNFLSMGIFTVVIAFPGLSHAQSMADIHKSQEKERARLEEQRDKSKSREVMRREFRKSIDDGAAVDLLKCSFFALAFGFENEVLQSANDGTFYFGPTTTGINHRDFKKSPDGIWKWGSMSGDFEYDSKQKKLYSKPYGSKEVDAYDCVILRKKISGSIF